MNILKSYMLRAQAKANAREIKLLVIKFLLSYGVVLLLATPCLASPWEKMVDQITKTRAEIEVLAKQTDVTSKKEQAEVDLWSQKKTELEGQLAREKMRGGQIHEKLKRLEARIKVDPKADPAGKKKLHEWLATYETTLKATIPFHVEKRMAVLADLKKRLDLGHEPHEFVLADFWSFLESEMKLSQSNDYRIVDVTISGQTKKCEVARLGLQALFVVTPSGQVLRASNNGSQWSWIDVNSDEQKESVLTLVKNLKDKKTSGYYLLPIDKAAMGASL